LIAFEGGQECLAMEFREGIWFSDIKPQSLGKREMQSASDIEKLCLPELESASC
jgi:hypothetical protein